jgi:ABC-type transport system involved in cytochrome c biogenesis permease subunit
MMESEPARSQRRPRVLGAFLSLTALFLAGQSAQAQEPARRVEPWSPEIVELFATLPVQDGGRVKPLDSLAGLHLLTFNGKRKLETGSGEKLKPSAWLLDCIFFPEQAKQYPSFYIRNDAVLTAIGIDTLHNDKKKTDRYSYDDLAPGRAKLQQEASRISQIETAQQTPVQSQTLKLAHDLFKFEGLTGFLEPLRWRYSTSGTQQLVELYGEGESSLSEVLRSAPALSAMMSGHLDRDQADFGELQALFRQLDSALERGSGGLAFLPPAAGAEDSRTWWSSADVVMAAFEGRYELAEYRAALESLEKLEATKVEPAAFEAELRNLHGRVVGLAEARGEYGHVPLEVKLYRWDPFTNSLVFYVLAFLLALVGFLAPRNKWVGYGLWGSTGIALGLAIFGIVLRCIIRGRPPVVSLYDTILFVTSVAVLVSLIAERLTRQRIALSMASVLGVAGMFLAMRYELKEIETAGDTMASVVAVLDTNYYLAIHVTSITMGYAGGLLAGAIAHVWILGQFFRLKRGDTQFYKTIIRMTYGILCFSLLFSIFGTIMGGVWANDSWGRFWGWDPKENGALLICIWQLLILHARMGGYIKDRGFAVMCVLGAVVVSASWWGVNLLSVGLHSYGFTSGVALALFSMWGFEALVVGLSGWDALMRRLRGTPA